MRTKMIKNISFILLGITAVYLIFKNFNEIPNFPLWYVGMLSIYLLLGIFGALSLMNYFFEYIGNKD